MDTLKVSKTAWASVQAMRIMLMIKKMLFQNDAFDAKLTDPFVMSDYTDLSKQLRTNSIANCLIVHRGSYVEV